MKNYVKSRDSTIRYDGGRMMQERIPQFNISDHTWLVDICKSGKCIYCSSDIISKDKTKGDHLFSVIKDRCTRQLNNFSKFTVPCCVKCNSSKGGLSWREYMSKHPEYVDNVATLKRINDFIEKHIVYYYYDYEKYDKIQIMTAKYLTKINEAYKNIEIFEFEKEFANLLI